MQNTFLSLPVVLLVLGLLGVYVFSVYNSLARLKVRIEEAWSQIDVQLKRRIDLIPNLVETVKGYATHEREVFENVTKARSALMGANNNSEAMEANNMLTGALKSLFAVAEAYPDLKASDNFAKLQEDVRDTEDKIAYSRQFYNTVVRDYNQKTVMFPSNIVAGLFGFGRQSFFDISDSDREPVKVNF